MRVSTLKEIRKKMTTTPRKEGERRERGGR
jgi:hypothetical protein